MFIIIAIYEVCTRGKQKNR